MSLIRVIRDLFCGRLSENDNRILNAIRGELSPNEVSAFDEQRRDVAKVQRGGGRRIVALYYSDKHPPRLFPGEGEYCLARVSFKERKRTSQASIWITRGELRSIEYSKVPKTEISIVSVKMRPERVVSTAAAIDRLEHE